MIAPDFLRNAFGLAKNGQTALVIVPNPERARELLNTLARKLINRERDWNARLDYSNHQFYFEGTRGSIRFYSADHPEWDGCRMRGYPVGTPTYIADEL